MYLRVKPTQTQTHAHTGGKAFDAVKPTVGFIHGAGRTHRVFDDPASGSSKVVTHTKGGHADAFLVVTGKLQVMRFVFQQG